MMIVVRFGVSVKFFCGCSHAFYIKIDRPWDIVFEWIPYNQFNDIKEIGRGGFVIYSAIWKNGPLDEYPRRSYHSVVLKCLHNSQNITNEFLNEVCYL